MHSPARIAWKKWYRQMRIVRRESEKAMMDCMVYGTGFVRVGADIPDYVAHLSSAEVFNEAAPISQSAWDKLEKFTLARGGSVYHTKGAKYENKP